MNSLNDSWFLRRGKFTHQWINNDFKTTLGWFCTMIEEGKVDPVSVELFLTETLPQWPDKSKEARSILKDGLFAMSPARLVEHPPLSNCPDNIKELMAHVCHLLWQTRNQQRFDEVEASIEAMDAAYDHIESEVATGKRHEDCIQEFRELKQATCELARAFERLKDAVNL